MLGRIFSLLKAQKGYQKPGAKYYKRIPKPSGKGYYYFYTQAEHQNYLDKKEKKHDKPSVGQKKLSGTVKVAGEKTGKRPSKDGGKEQVGSKPGKPAVGGGHVGVRPPRKGSAADDGRKLELAINGGNIDAVKERERREYFKQTKKDREKVMQILATKEDSEITENEKDLMRNVDGPGATGDKNTDWLSALTAYYTPKAIVSKMVSLVKKYFGKSPEVLEPCAGSGRFIDGVKKEFPDAKIECGENDPVSSRILKILHPDVEIKEGKFESRFMKNNKSIKDYDGKKFDLVITNPPYAQFKGFEKGLGEGKGHSRYETYFMDRSLDTLKEGGIMAVVVPSSFMSGIKNKKVKEAIAKKGRLMEAYRLPNDVFNNTDVGTDILVIRKEKGNVADFSDKYFTDNPDNILGDKEKRKDWRSGEEKEYIKGDLSNLSKIDVNKPIPNYEGKMSQETKDKISEALIGNDNAKKPFKKEGKKKTPPIKLTHPEEQPPSKPKRALTDEEFREKYQKGHDPKDVRIWENVQIDGSVDTTKIAVDHERMGYYEGKYYHNVNMYSGDVRVKIDYYEENKESIIKEIGESNYNKTLKKLKESLPSDVDIKKINIGVLTDLAQDTTFNMLVDSSSYWQKNKELRETTLKEAFKQWVNGLGANELGGMSQSEIRDYCDKHPMRFKALSKKAVKEMTPEEKRAWEEKKNELKNLRRKVSERLFNQWLHEHVPEETLKEVQYEYNKQFNYYVTPDYNKIPLIAHGMSDTFKGSELNLIDLQNYGIKFLGNKGAGILAHGTGSGKTLEGIIATIQNMQLGRCKRPLIVVPKQVYEKWIREIKDVFPNIKLVELGNLGSGYPEEIEKLGVQDGALHLATYYALESNITFKPETVKQLTENMRDVMENIYPKKKKKGGKKVFDEEGNEIEAGQEGTIETWVGEGLKTASKLGAKYFWEDLGFDHITVDECLPYNTKILTDDGWKKIGDIVENRLTCRVVSYNYAKESFEIKPIVSWLPKKLNHEIVKLNLSNGGYLISTHNHKIWTENGYEEAKNTKGKNVFVLRERKKEEESNLLLTGLCNQGTNREICTSSEKMRMVWKNFSIQIVGGMLQFKKKILLSSMFGILQKFIASHKGTSKKESICFIGSQKGEKRSDGIRTNEIEQSNAQSNYSGKSKKIYDWKKVFTSWREWIFNKTSNIIGFNFITTNGVFYKYKECENYFSENPEQLQSRFGNCGKETSYRNRWERTFKTEEEKGRFKEEHRFEKVRVESVEVLERGSFEKYGFRSPEDQTVYDIEVADNHNFIAEGVLVSNCHNFKNVFAGAKVERGKGQQESNEFQGLSSGTSTRAAKLFLTTKLLQEQTEGKNVFLLTATPFQNSPIEIFNMLSFVAGKRLKSLGLSNLNKFLSTFADINYEWGVDLLSGDVKKKNQVKRFNNVKALQTLIREYIDFKTDEDAGCIKPKLTKHKMEFSPSPIQKMINSIEVDRASSLDLRDMAISMNNNRMNSLAPSLVWNKDLDDPKKKIHPEYLQMREQLKSMSSGFVQDSPKLMGACNIAAGIYQKRPDVGQIFFMPRGISNYPDVVNYLTSQGIPKDAIFTIHSKKMSSERDHDKVIQAVKDFNDPNGKIKIIIGSSTIHEGIDLNGNTAIGHNLMQGWNPTEEMQKVGRFERQGNMQESVHMLYYNTHDSVDSAIYQKHDEKTKRFEHVWSYTGQDVFDVEDIDPGELKYDLIRDPNKIARLVVDQKKSEIMEEVKKLDTEISILDKHYQSFKESKEQYDRARRDSSEYEKEFENQKDKYEQAKKDFKEIEKKFKNGEIDKWKFDSEERNFGWKKDQYEDAKKSLKDNDKTIKLLENTIASVSVKIKDRGLTTENIEEKIKDLESQSQKHLDKIHAINDDIPNIVEDVKQRIAERAKTIPPFNKQVSDKVNDILSDIGKTQEEGVTLNIERKSKRESGTAKKLEQMRLTKSHPPALQIGPKGGRFYMSSGKKIYPGQALDATREQIKTAKNPDHVTNAIFAISHLKNAGIITGTEAAQLNVEAEKKMKSLSGEGKRAAQIKREARENKIMKIRRSELNVREAFEQAGKQKYSEKVHRIKPRFDKWKKTMVAAMGEERKSLSKIEGINSQLKELVPMANKFREKKAELTRLYETTPKDSPDYAKLVDEIRKHNSEFKAVKEKYAALKQNKDSENDRLSRIYALRDKAKGIVTDYAGQAGRSREILLNKALELWIMK